jgi:phosphate/sulfate permease
MEMFFIFIVMLAIVGIIAGFVYHPIITILISVAIIFLLSKTLFKSDKEKYTETVPINPERSEFIISKIERTLTCFACYVPYIDIYLKQIDSHKYKIVIRVDFINDRFDFNADWVSEHVFPTWKDDLYENSLGKKVQRLIWEFPFCSSSITSTSDVAAFAKYIQKENQNDLKEIVNTTADIAKDAVTTTTKAVAHGITNEETMFCKHCGAKIDVDSKFCKSCGKEL